MTFIKAQEETLLNRLTNDYELNLFNIFGNTPSNADANMLVLGVLTKLTTVIEPGMMRNISEYVSKNGVSNTIKKLFNSKNYSNTLRDILGNSFSRTTHLERGVNPSYQCNKYLDSKLEDKCWICGGRCKDNPKLSIETNSSPKTKKRKRGGSGGGTRSRSRDRTSPEPPSRKSQRPRKESRKKAEDATSETLWRDMRAQEERIAANGCGTQRQCEHILPVCSGLMFLELASTLTQKVSHTVKEMVKLEYRWSHSLCNGIKSDRSLIKLNIQGSRNYFQIDETACADLSRAINNKNNKADEECGVEKVESLADRPELTYITEFLNKEVTNSNIDKVLALAFLKLVFASKLGEHISAPPQKKTRRGGGPGGDIDSAIDYAFEEFDNIVYGVARKIQEAKRGIGKLDESFWISENLKDTPSIYWQELEKTTKSSITSSPITPTGTPTRKSSSTRKRSMTNRNIFAAEQAKKKSGQKTKKNDKKKTKKNDKKKDKKKAKK